MEDLRRYELENLAKSIRADLFAYGLDIRIGEIERVIKEEGPGFDTKGYFKRREIHVYSTKDDNCLNSTLLRYVRKNNLEYRWTYEKLEVKDILGLWVQLKFVRKKRWIYLDL